MGITGVVVNGRIELNEPGLLPEGATVTVGWGETEEEYLESLRRAYEESKLGRGTDARAFLKEMALRNNLPLEPGE